MVRRSDYCLPSDSDKFTIKLHSLPSKFLFLPSSSQSLALPFPSSCLLSPLSFSLFISLCGHVGASSEKSWYILASDNHNSLYTRATVSPSPPLYLPPGPLLPLSLFVLFRPFHPCPDPPCLLSLSLFIFSFSFPRRVVLLSSPPPDDPVASTTAIPQLFSTLLALVAVAVVLPGDFACLPLPPRTLPCAFFPSPLSFSLFLSLVLSLASFFAIHSSRPFAVVPRYPGIGIYFSLEPRRTFGLTSLPPVSLVPFVLEVAGIHETKLMITTSKQRAERPAATCRAIYISQPLHLVFLSFSLPTRPPIFLPSLLSLFLRSSSCFLDTTPYVPFAPQVFALSFRVSFVSIALPWVYHFSRRE